MLRWVVRLEIVEAEDLAVPRLKDVGASLFPTKFVKDMLDVIADRVPRRLPDLPESRIRRQDALALADMTVKSHFDRRHLAQFFEVGQQVLL